MNGIEALKKRERETRELAHFLCPVKTQKTTVFEPGSQSSPDTESDGNLILDFPASRTDRNKSVV